MQKAERRLASILRKFKTFDIPVEQISKLDVVKSLHANPTKLRIPLRSLHFGFLCVPIFSFWLLNSIVLNNSECLLEMPLDTSALFRAPEDCNICQDVYSVNKLTNISASDFDTSYASTSRPVVISDGAKNWRAMNHFSFDFFKELYTSVSDEDMRFNCQFFPYKTEFTSLQEVLNMKEKRAKFEIGEKPWYIGWSNCNDKAGEMLRQYYDRPYFLPNTSENLALNWIFMGGPGQGAHLHVDNVEYPSWQAQISGRKTWILAPPPECVHKCKNMQVTVEPGEIIVVDTNKWYHQTNILPGQISITIGCDPKMIRKLQIGIKKRPELCNHKSKKGDLLHIFYKGCLEDGKEFDTNVLGNRPFTFTLGSGEVIKGWDQGLIGMCIGEKRKLVIPPDLAFGEYAIDTIPPNSTLTFHIELVNIENKEDS